MTSNNIYFSLLRPSRYAHIRHQNLRFRSLYGACLSMAIVVVMSVAGLCPNIAAAADCIKPIAHWKLDEEEAASPTFQNNISQGMHTGSCRQENSVSYCPQPEPGRYGIGQKFYTDGKPTGIDIPASPQFDWSDKDSFSISFWMKRDDTPLNRNEVIIGRNSGTTISRLHWWVGVHQSGTANSTLKDRAGQIYGTLKSDKLIIDNTWHFIVLVRDGFASESRLYIDGMLEDTIRFTHDIPGAFSESSTGLTIGWMDNSGIPFSYKGSVDEIAIYDTALPQWFIRDRYYADQRYGTKQPDHCD